MNGMNFWGYVALIYLVAGLIGIVYGEPVSVIQVPQVNIPVYQDNPVSTLSATTGVQNTDNCMNTDSRCEITLSITGTGPFHPGETVTVSGNNTFSDISYLFMNGQNLPANGGSLIDPFVEVMSDQPASFTMAPVSSSDTWSYNWTIPQQITQNGTYTLFVVAAPKNLTNIGETQSDSIAVNLTPSTVKSVVIRISGIEPFHPGDTITISGNDSVSDTAYLFMNGQNLPANGGSLIDPFVEVISEQPASFTMVPVSDSDTWSYNWTIPQQITQNGTYTLFVVAAPKNLTNIGETQSDSIQIPINRSSITDIITLFTGWNFISAPDLLRQGYDTMSIFAQVNSSGHSILTYEGENQSWITMKANDSFTPLTGIWIFSASTCQVPLVYDNYTSTPSRSLVKGWNTLGITRPDRPVDDALSSIASNWSYLVGYNATVQQYKDPIIKDGGARDSIVLQTKDGLWIYMKENAIYRG